MNTEKIYIGALNKWGAERQIKKCLEECSELMVALCQCSDGRDNVRHVAEEIADVRIMLNQMAILFDCETLVERQMEYKLERLERRVFDGDGEKCNDG